MVREIVDGAPQHGLASYVRRPGHGARTHFAVGIVGLYRLPHGGSGRGAGTAAGARVVHQLLFYVMDNEIHHHRGQGYVYLRALGIEPPAFYERT
jgi:hypothetical protein